MLTAEKTILIIIAILLAFDAVTNIFLLVFAPKWETVKRRETIALRKYTAELEEQNAELREFIYQMQEDGDIGSEN